MLFRSSLALKSSLPVALFCRNESAIFQSTKMNNLSRTCTSFRIVFASKFQHGTVFCMAKRAADFSTSSAEAILDRSTDFVSRASRKKARKESPEMLLRVKLENCSKIGDLGKALRLYNEAKTNKIQLDVYHYNILLYLCSPRSDEDKGDLARLDKGFEIFKQMNLDKVEPNEATFSNVSRLAAARKDPELAFVLIKKMKDHGIAPRLRSYGPALLGFCEKGMANEAYEVDLHMKDNGVCAEESGLSALLSVSSQVNRDGKVYEMMHRLRATVRQVSEETATIIEGWFKSNRAAEVGAEKWDAGQVRKGVLEGGGGWHGQGWLGKGKWSVARTTVNESGLCQACAEKLVCIDIDPTETENFAASLAKLALKRESQTSFASFQEWLQQHGPFDAVIDGANLGLANQFAFNFFQINKAVNQVCEVSPSKRMPLVVLHKSRVTGGPAKELRNQKLLEKWRKAGALYSTPPGSNDDWYWLYAAVSSKCLVVTNDEMRDHLFNLLGNNFFPRWKEKHQVRVKVSASDGLKLVMPPPYSIVIQESEQGHWHVPIVKGTEDDFEAPRQWVCVNRIPDIGCV